MAATTAPSGRSLLGHVVARLQQRASAKDRVSKVARVVGDHAATMAALGFADTACWHWGTGAGLVGTAVAILVAEFKVRG